MMIPLALRLRWKKGRERTQTFWWRWTRIPRRLEHPLVSVVDQLAEKEQTRKELFQQCLLQILRSYQIVGQLVAGDVVLA